MGVKIDRHILFPVITALAAVILFALSVIGERTQGSTESIVGKAEKRLEKRIDILEGYVERLLDGQDEAICSEGLPEDMVIYKYVNDSLALWLNQFPILNDDISNRLVFQRLTNLKSSIVSPLADVGEDYSYINLGSKWFIIRSVTGDNKERIIAAVEIQNTLIDDARSNDSGINPLIGIPYRYTVLPLNYSGGSPVIINGRPIFKVHTDNTGMTYTSSTAMPKWIAMLLVIISALTLLYKNRTFKAFAISTAAVSIVFAIAYAWGLRLSGSTEIFSPNTYADGPILFSLGALMLVNSYIAVLSICIYLMRETIYGFVRRRTSWKAGMVIYCIALTLCIITIVAYIHTTLQSLLYNSHISMAVFRPNIDLVDSISVYLSYFGLFLCIWLYLLMLSTALRSLTGIRINLLSKKNIAIFALAVAVYLSLTTETYSIRREQDRATVWANKLAVERDLGLEIRLKAVENDIASDPIISSLANLDGAEGLILSRISENFLSRIRQSHSLDILLYDDEKPELSRYYTELLESGTPIYDGSHFFFISDGLGHSKYVGFFLYYTRNRSLTRMFLEIEPNSNTEEGGYNDILNLFSTPDGINIPKVYSYAKYADGKLTSYKGNYPYPTVSDKFEHNPDPERTRILRFDEFTHFARQISDNEIIVISRPHRNNLVFFTSLSYTFLMMLGLMMLFRRRRRKAEKSNFFRTRINIILFISSAMILASMTVVSIFFVYKRNSENIINLMSSKISTVQAMIERHARGVRNYSEITTPGFKAMIEEISKTTKSDITLYTPEGRVFYTSRPEVFDKMIFGNRINHDAYHNITHLHRRFFINQEQTAGHSYRALYAPVINAEGDIIAIVCVPASAGDHDFLHDATIHAALLVNIFLLLLIISLLFSTREVNDMFAPLMEMGKKMNINNIHDLRPITYKKVDEISSLVDAYNRMVKELADSTVRLAQAERDKAWSQMARQVAHEIKNPLTPIKLEIQRLIRLKTNGNPKWEERFDNVANVVLEHIDILTDTANEFSTFAKLYSEEPVVMDLDRTIKDQILIFDNKPDITIEYIGMENAIVTAPRPQLIRVFVNLITNAIQAVEIKRKEMAESGDETFRGKVFIALRNGTADGFYDIVVEDNGAGVKEENLSKLFTPNFTTKSGGTGLGLAICRNIIEKCEGTISYSKSYRLGGAAFTVSLPKQPGSTSVKQ